MALHLIKLCVGVDTIGELEEWIAERPRRFGPRADGRHVHVTRMLPKRSEALLDGGSLFWVIKGQLSCRQALLGVESFTDGEGVSRCRLVLDPAVVAVHPRPVRPFQGWRYLDGEEAPDDLGEASGAVQALPEAMRRELVSLGLL
jgi:hypothetical protein